MTWSVHPANLCIFLSPLHISRDLERNSYKSKGLDEYFICGSRETEIPNRFLSDSAGHETNRPI